MSAAERMRAYRARIRSNQDLHNLYKEQDRQRKNLEREGMSSGKLKELRRQGAEATHRWRYRKIQDDEEHEHTHPEIR